MPLKSISYSFRSVSSIQTYSAFSWSNFSNDKYCKWKANPFNLQDTIQRLTLLGPTLISLKIPTALLKKSFMVCFELDRLHFSLKWSTGNFFYFVKQKTLFHRADCKLSKLQSSADPFLLKPHTHTHTH